MMDITQSEVRDDAKRKVLEQITGILQDAGLHGYELGLYKPTRVKAAPNIQVFQTAAYLAATTLSPSANKILMYFLSVSEFENYIGVDIKTINEALSISYSSCEKGLRELRENGVILKIQHPNDKRRNDYFINPMQAWKGKILNRKIALEKLNKADTNKITLFGEGFEETTIRESKEIKAKKPLLNNR